jgi:periplasmic protein TonB
MKRDLLIGFLGAAGIHVTVLFGLETGLFQDIQFGVSQGESSVEVSLVSSVPQREAVESTPQTETVPETREIMPDEIPDGVVMEHKPEPLPDQKLKQVSPRRVQSPSKSAAAVAVSTDGGARAKPFYLKNEPPTYPESSRRRGEEGVVLLNVTVDEQGETGSVVIKQSSGFSRLDQAAVKAVERWKFNPARVGSIAVSSQIEIPIRFRLNENE